MLDYPREPTSVIFHISTYKMMHGVVQQPIHLKARFCVGVSQTPIFHKIIRRDRRGVDSRIIAVLFLQSYGNFRSHRTRRRPRKTRIDDMRCSARRLHVMELGLLMVSTNQTSCWIRPRETSIGSVGLNMSRRETAQCLIKAAAARGLDCYFLKSGLLIRLLTS